MAAALFWVALCAVAYATPLLVQPQPQPRTLVDTNTWDQLVFYAPFASASYNGICPHPPHDTVLQHYFNFAPTDTQAALFRADDRKEFILSFPGTSGLADFLTDVNLVPVPYIASGVNCIGCLVHLGFLLAWNSASLEIERVLTEALAQHPDYTLTITGHSLGGALETLAFGSLASRSSFRVRGSYAYGAPRVGNVLFANYIEALAGVSDQNPGIHYRVTRGDDFAAHIPFNVLGVFSHPRTEYWEANDTNGNPSEATTFRCFGQEPVDCVNSMAPAQGSNAHGSYAGLLYSCL